ncbi:MAG TPA: hypothetical protein ENF81_04965 [Thermotogaceae bacterium]|nr:hypothetical protein [Thermotogaceae bacterium]
MFEKEFEQISVEEFKKYFEVEYSISELLNRLRLLKGIYICATIDEALEVFRNYFIKEYRISQNLDKLSRFIKIDQWVKECIEERGVNAVRLDVHGKTYYIVIILSERDYLRERYILSGKHLNNDWENVVQWDCIRRKKWDNIKTISEEEFKIFIEKMTGIKIKYSGQELLKRLIDRTTHGIYPFLNMGTEERVNIYGYFKQYFGAHDDEDDIWYFVDHWEWWEYCCDNKLLIILRVQFDQPYFIAIFPQELNFSNLQYHLQIR